MKLSSSLGLSECFKNCSSLKTLIFPDSINPQTFCNFAFSGCTSLESINLGKLQVHVTASTDSSFVFKDCKKLKSIATSNS